MYVNMQYSVWEADWCAFGGFQSEYHPFSGLQPYPQVIKTPSDPPQPPTPKTEAPVPAPRASDDHRACHRAGARRAWGGEGSSEKNTCPTSPDHGPRIVQPV